jgi:hypothetical protein
MSTAGVQSNFPQLVSDLVGMQDDVQTYAPSLASQWGWLASQGKALVAGSGASITQSAWVAQYRAFFQALQSAEGGQDQMEAANAWHDLTPGSLAVQAACSTTNLTTNAAAAAAAPFNAFSAFWAQYGTMIIVGSCVVGVLLLAPPIIRAVKGDK